MKETVYNVKYIVNVKVNQIGKEQKIRNLDMEAEEIKKVEEIVIKDEEIVNSDVDGDLGNGDVTSSVDASLEDQSTGRS